MIALGRKLRMRTLHNSAILALVASCFGSSALAAPAAKTPAGAPPVVAAPAKLGAKPDAAKPAAAAAPKAPGPATKPALAPTTKPTTTSVVKPAAAATPTVKPKPAPVHVAAAPPRLAEPAVSRDEVVALRAEMKALREELNHAVGAPPAAPSAARQELENELAAEQKKLAAIQAAVDGGLDRAAVADSITSTEAHVVELQANLAKLPAVEAPAQRSLYEVSTEIDRLHATAQEPPASNGLEAAKVVAASTPPKPLLDDKPPPSTDMMENMGLLPLEFTAFGDFYYRFERPGADDFHVGAVELDASLKLTPYVNVSTAIVFDGAQDTFGLGAFVIDCGVAGDGDGYVLPSKHVVKSGVSFGRFDVPFGIAYLEYPSVENRLVTLPQAVQLTHGGWNDVGAQGYAVGEHWTAVGYVVNGPEHPVSADAVEPSRTAAGVRLSAKVDELIEVGGSGALDFAAAGPVMAFAGGDIQTTLGPLDVRGEYLLKHVKTPGIAELTHGVYGQALLKVDPAFLVARYDTVLEGASTFDRRVAGGAGIEIFPQGEVRAVYEHSFDSDIRTVTLQLVGGSSFQPTGLRR
jgi:hypothetical protein